MASLGFAAILLFALAAAIRGAFLMALVPLAMAGMLGSSTGYVHATYMLMVTEPGGDDRRFSRCSRSGRPSRLESGRARL